MIYIKIAQSQISLYQVPEVSKLLFCAATEWKTAGGSRRYRLTCFLLILKLIKCPSPLHHKGTWQQPHMGKIKLCPSAEAWGGGFISQQSWTEYPSICSCLPRKHRQIRKPEGGSVIILRPCLWQSLGWQQPAVCKAVSPSWNWIGKDLMALKALALSVMESDRGESARKLWQTEGSTVEHKVRGTGRWRESTGRS